MDVRKFTNVTFVDIDYRGGSAKILASVGGCRLNLSWTRNDGLKLDGDSQINGLPGEFTARDISESATYKVCAQQPAPTTAPSAPPTP
jgi:hypothetical protein